ncbi:SPRY domain-containing SOCS box protein 1-like [Amia ocellicauda]|uniref:SPRY domain-containing SOCS box protein 1-like n=1 Tax=Amia ocellicauda TaxID=2972642 RepID=UPI0034646FA8
MQGPDYSKPPCLDKLLGMDPANQEVQLKHSWNNDDRSNNITVMEDNLTFRRNGGTGSTDCIRGKVGYTRGLHVWEINWPRNQRGTYPVVGVATADAPIFSMSYESLVGSNNKSWGWDMRRNKLYHNQQECTYPKILQEDESLVVADSFRVVLDMDEGMLSFIVNGQYLGVAFK